MNKKCFENSCIEAASQTVEDKNYLFYLCPHHARAYQFNAAFSRVLSEMREAESAGNLALAAQLDREQIQMQSDFWQQKERFTS